MEKKNDKNRAWSLVNFNTNNSLASMRGIFIKMHLNTVLSEVFFFQHHLGCNERTVTYTSKKPDACELFENSV